MPQFQQEIIAWFKDQTSGSKDLAFKGKQGRAVFDTYFRHKFNDARKKAGITKHIAPHYGRNWLIARLAEGGATSREIGAILGQTDLETIINVYMKVWDQRLSDLMEGIKIEGCRVSTGGVHKLGTPRGMGLESTPCQTSGSL